uniref:Ig-like domain-containing protein n=1 Tax=Gasterosteus aculeatus aculeatus TaxID=481459 RepID=A0AAQ4P8H7_GASAC
SCLWSGALLYATPGQSVTVPCFYASGAKHICWYKQVAGEQPQIISSFYKHSPDSNSFHNQFKDNKRFSVYAGAGFYHLNISNVQDSDSAMYYCGHATIMMTEFDDGTLLVLKGILSFSFLQLLIRNNLTGGYSVRPRVTPFLHHVLVKVLNVKFMVLESIIRIYMTVISGIIIKVNSCLSAQNSCSHQTLRISFQ